MKFPLQYCLLHSSVSLVLFALVFEHKLREIINLFFIVAFVTTIEHKKT